MNLQDLFNAFMIPADRKQKPHKKGMWRNGREPLSTWHHPTRPDKKESKAMRKMRAASRKINRRK